MNNTAINSNIKSLAAIIIAAAIAFAGMAVASEAGAQSTITGTITSGTTTASTATTTLSTEALQTRVFQLEQEVDMLSTELFALRLQFQAFLTGSVGTSTATSTPGTGTSGDNDSGNGGDSTATTSAGIRISPESTSVRAGTNVDFNGRGFWGDEQVTIMRDAQVVGAARADSAGNFSTGSITVPFASGSYTYIFKGDWSGMSGTSVVHVDR